jgi:hypothetical protein
LAALRHSGEESKHGGAGAAHSSTQFGIFMASANSKNARRLFRRSEKRKKKRPRKKKKKKRMLKYLFFFSRCASIKQPDAHNFSCQAQFSSSSLFSSLFLYTKIRKKRIENKGGKKRNSPVCGSSSQINTHTQQDGRPGMPCVQIAAHTQGDIPSWLSSL